MRQGFSVDVPMYLIQSIRLTHALMESDYEVCIPPEHVGKFSMLRDKFDAKFTVGVEGRPVLAGLQLLHPEPRTSVGSITRPLIFPQVITDHLKRIWSADRRIKYSFSGLLTPSRQEVIGGWLNRNFPAQAGRLSKYDSPWRQLRNRIRRRLGMESESFSLQVGDVQLSCNNRGRTFPIKSWDEEYFQLLGRSQFVLCPSGDHVWSYRFFESILCGAIPIVEDVCPAYDGFHFHRMSDPPSSLSRTDKLIENNFQLCRERLTVDRSELNIQIEGLLAGGDKC